MTIINKSFKLIATDINSDFQRIANLKPSPVNESHADITKTFTGDEYITLIESKENEIHFSVVYKIEQGGISLQMLCKYLVAAKLASVHHKKNLTKFFINNAEKSIQDLFPDIERLNEFDKGYLRHDELTIVHAYEIILSEEKDYGNLNHKVQYSSFTGLITKIAE
ncbi:MAG: hypothetical protein OXE99_03950 [Cellvibrionales bacterium]|nr:hypothetical protein [Cellvibrionales bacterium]